MKYITICRHDVRKDALAGTLMVYDNLDCIKPLFSCQTLERFSKRVPNGDYFTTISRSRKFKCLLPELHKVPNRLGIRIHFGNYYSDSEGCILVGKSNWFDFADNDTTFYINHSRVTLDNLMSILGDDYIVTHIFDNLHLKEQLNSIYK